MRRSHILHIRAGTRANRPCIVQACTLALAATARGYRKRYVITTVGTTRTRICEPYVCVCVRVTHDRSNSMHIFGTHPPHRDESTRTTSMSCRILPSAAHARALHACNAIATGILRQGRKPRQRKKTQHCVARVLCSFFYLTNSRSACVCSSMSYFTIFYIPTRVNRIRRHVKIDRKSISASMHQTSKNDSFFWFCSLQCAIKHIHKKHYLWD